MIKVFITADWHLKIREGLGINVIDGYNDRLLDKIKLISEMVQKALELEVDYFFILGDVFDRPNPSELLRCFFFNSIKPLFAKGIKVRVVSGNHGTEDWKMSNLLSESNLTSYISEEIPFLVLNKIEKYTLYPKRVLKYEVKDESFKQVDSLSGPVVIDIFPDSKKEDLYLYLDKQPLSKIAFGHLNVTGAVYSNGVTNFDRGVPLDKFSKYSKVFLGDIHCSHEVGNCVYVGAPWANKIDELNYPHGALYLQLATSSDERSSYDVVFLNEFIELIDKKLFLKETTLELFIADIKKLSLQFDSKKYIAYISVLGAKDDLLLVTFDFSKLKKELLNLGFYDVRIVYKLLDSRNDNLNEKVLEDKNIIQSEFSLFCQEKCNNKKEIIDFGKDLLRKAYEIEETFSN